MAPAAATKKAADKKAEDPAAPEAEAPKRTPRTTQKLTMSQTKVIEAQFDTRIKDAGALDGKLGEILDKFEDNTESFVPVKVLASRKTLAEGIALIEQAKAEFAEIGEQYRSFFG